jgi:hypothetical protein
MGFGLKVGVHGGDQRVGYGGRAAETKMGGQLELKAFLTVCGGDGCLGQHRDNCNVPSVLLFEADHGTGKGGLGLILSGVLK